jgi:hypothetical protein
MWVTDIISWYKYSDDAWGKANVNEISSKIHSNIIQLFCVYYFQMI